MDGPFDTRNPLVALVDETLRLNGRFKGVFAELRRLSGLGDAELMVLNAVVEAKRMPTVPQIGRSLGHPRQTIQHAVKALLARGLIETAQNPDHVRAVLLYPTAAGIAFKRELDSRGDAIAESLLASVDPELARAATLSLRAIRQQLEARLRGEGD